MSKAMRTIVTNIVSLLVMTVAGAARRAPNFSGAWVLVTTTTTSTRSSGQVGRPPGSGDSRPMSNTVSGAAFNCGRECAIVHEGQSLTIDKALLGSDVTPAPAVTLRLDGRQMSVVDSFNPGRQVAVASTWKGDKLEITSGAGSRRTTQLLSVEAAELVVVVTSVNTASAQSAPPVTLRYRTK